MTTRTAISAFQALMFTTYSAIGSANQATRAEPRIHEVVERAEAHLQLAGVDGLY